MRRPSNVASYQPDLYSTPAILDPYPHYTRLRELGPAVWLTKHRVYALPRFAECKTVQALLERVDRIELTEQPSWGLNNIIRCYERLPLKLIAA